jgi:hypothetical protein
MHYNLFFNGCSFTEGGELEGPNRDLEYQRTYRFSHLVSENLGVNYINLASPGKSSDWIVENTVKWFEQGNTCDLAIIQFTAQKRTILYGKDRKEYHIFNPVLKSQKEIYPTFSQDFIKIANNYYKDIYTDYFGCQNLYKNLFFIHSYFKNKNIPAIFMKLFSNEITYNSGWKFRCKNIEITPIVENIIPILPCHDKNKKYYCKDYTSLYSKNNLHAKVLTGTHPNEYGHQLISDYVISKIKSKGYAP